MKTSITAMAAACLTLALSCTKEKLHITQQKSFNVPFTSVASEQTLLQDSRTSLLLEVKNISDQRCPLHQFCNDPGLATVRFTISDQKKFKGESFLHASNVFSESPIKDSVVISVNDQPFSVRLHDVTPHSFQNTTELQKAEISIKPL